MFYKMMAKASENRIWKTKDGKGFRIQNKENKTKEISGRSGALAPLKCGPACSPHLG